MCRLITFYENGESVYAFSGPFSVHGKMKESEVVIGGFPAYIKVLYTTSPQSRRIVCVHIQEKLRRAGELFPHEWCVMIPQVNLYGDLDCISEKVYSFCVHPLSSKSYVNMTSYPVSSLKDIICDTGLDVEKLLEIIQSREIHPVTDYRKIMVIEDDRILLEEYANDKMGNIIASIDHSFHPYPVCMFNRSLIYGKDALSIKAALCDGIKLDGILIDLIESIAFPHLPKFELYTFVISNDTCVISTHTKRKESENHLSIVFREIEIVFHSGKVGGILTTMNMMRTFSGSSDLHIEITERISVLSEYNTFYTPAKYARTTSIQISNMDKEISERCVEHKTTFLLDRKKKAKVCKSSSIEYFKNIHFGENTVMICDRNRLVNLFTKPSISNGTEYIDSKMAYAKQVASFLGMQIIVSTETS